MCTPRAGNPGNVLLPSRNPPKYFYQWYITEVVLQKYLIRLALKFIHNKKETKVTNSQVNCLSVSLKSSNPLMYLQLLVLLELSIFRPSCLYKLIFYQLPIFRTNLLPLILWKHPKNNLMPLQLVLNPKLYIPTSTLNIELIFWHNTQGTIHF